jgi:hypothetical protein
MNDRSIRKIIITTIVIVVMLILGMATYRYYMSKTKGTVTIDVSPRDLTLTLNGEKTSTRGSRTLTPGTYKLEASRTGFTNKKAEFTIAAGEKRHFNFYLIPSSQEGIDHLKENPADEAKFEGQATKDADKKTEKAIDGNALISELPYYGPGLYFRIGYGAAAVGSKYPDQPTIFIQAETEEHRQDALTWIRSHGYDPDKMNITFTNKP